MRKFVMPVIGIAGALLALYATVMWFTVWSFQVTTEDAYVQADIAAIVTKLSGYVESIKVSDNQTVKAGEVLLTLDTADIRPRLDQAIALVESRKAGVANAEAKLLLQKALIRQAEALLLSSNVDTQRARADVERYRKLAERGVVSQQKLETIRSDIGKADAATSRMRAGVDAERDQVPVLTSALNQAKADLKQADALAAQASADLGNAVLRAPFDGVVGNRTVQTGQYLRTGTQVMAVVPLPHVYVVANFKETQIGDIQVGQSAEISVDAVPGIKLNGTIESFAPASGALFSLLPPENATGNFTKVVQRIPVRIRLDGKASDLARLKAGMSVGVLVDVRSLAPTSAEKTR